MTGDLQDSLVLLWSYPPWRLILTAVIFFWGACIGSFLNVCIYRIPLELSIVKPRSFCPACNKPIPWYLNIPLLSWLMLAGRCRCCHVRISPRYFLVELLTGLLFLTVWLKFDTVPGARPLQLVGVTSLGVIAAYWLVVWGLVLGTFVDFEHFIIPDRVTIGGIVAGLVLSPLIPELHGETLWWRGAMWGGIGAAIGFGTLWLVAAFGKLIFKKDAMGFGDVKLMGAIGAFFGARAVLFTILVSSLAGSVVGLALVAARSKSMQSRIPYGPYLALGALVWMLWGERLWQGYMSLMGGLYVLP